MLRLVAILAVLGLAAGTASGGEPRYVRASSRSSGLIFEAPGAGAWFLLEPGGQLILVPRGELHRLVQGTLLVARSRGVPGNEPISLQLAGFRLRLSPGAALVEKRGENEIAVHVLAGEAAIGTGDWSRAVAAGQSFLGVPGTRPVVQATDPALVATRLETFRALAQDPLPVERDGPLASAVVGRRTVEDGNTWFRFDSTDPRLKDVRAIRHFGTTQAIGAAGTVSGPPPVRVPRDAGRFTFLEVRDGVVSGGVGVHVEKLEISNGFLLRNVLEAEGPKYARALLDGGIFVVTPSGGSVVVERVHDTYGVPTSRTRIILPQGYGFLDFRHMEKRNAGELTYEVQSGNRGFTVVSDRQGDLRLSGLLLIQDGSRVNDVPAMTARARREQRELLGPRDPCVTVLTALPKSAVELRAAVPLMGLADPRALLQVGSTVKLGQKGEGPAGAGLWVTEARATDETAPLATFEAFQEALGGPLEASLDPELTADVLRPLIVPGAMPEDLSALRELIAHGGAPGTAPPPGIVLPFEEVGRRTIDLGRALSTLILLGFLLCLGIAGSRTDLGRILFRGTVRCPHCRGPAGTHWLLRGDPTKDFDCAEAMARLARDGTEEGEEIFVRQLRALAATASGARTNPYFVLWAHWCLRCSRGFLRTQVVRGLRIIDQDLVEFGSAKTWAELRKGS